VASNKYLSLVFLFIIAADVAVFLCNTFLQAGSSLTPIWGDPASCEAPNMTNSTLHELFKLWALLVSNKSTKKKLKII
jgi:hypothetical protein